MCEAIDVKAELLTLVETRIVCPRCGVTWDLEGNLGDHLVDCPECDAELRLRVDGLAP
jgi:transposase